MILNFKKILNKLGFKKNVSENVALFDGASRTDVVKHHITLTFVFNIIALGLSFVLVPLTVNYLDVEKYGIWMTLLSVLSWATFFDIGLGNGMKNKLAEALAANNIKSAKEYISTTYIVIILIALALFLILLCVLPFVNFNKIFNTEIISNNELARVIFAIGIFFLFNFILSLCNQIFYAYQKASLASLNHLLLNLFAVISTYFLIHFTFGRLLYLAISYGGSMVLASFLLTYYFFKKHPEVKPSIKYINLSKTRELISLGVKFFIIQIAVLIIVTTDNIIITQVLGPAEVTPYNIVYKLFSIVPFGWSILVGPLWSAYTEAYKKKDIKWIQNTIKKLNILIVPTIIFTLVLIVFAKNIINIWVGYDIKYSQSLVILMGIYALINAWNGIYATFVNGIGRINPQLCTAIIGGIINIPISIYFAKSLNMGSSGVILGTIISLAIFSIIGPIQTYYILKNPQKSYE